MFAIWLKPFRESLGYTQAKCAALADIDLTQWERWDNARNTPRTKHYPTIAKGLEYDRWEDWFKDFHRFAGIFPEFVDSPWTEKMGKPIFTRAFGKGAKVDRSQIIHDDSTKYYNLHGERPLSLVVERMMSLNLDRIVSKTKRDELEQRQRNLIQRAAILEADLRQLTSAAVVRQRKSPRA
jgi:transcriptional regulator with XRE-family HTH domain